MRKTLVLALLSGIFAALAANAQSAPQADPSVPAAPIVRSYPGQGRPGAAQTFDLQPSAGIFVRTDTPNGVEALTATEALTELRLLHGRATITVHHPTNHTQILVDLPGGQVSLFKDGLYTFNTATNTVRVLHGEAEAFLDPHDIGKGTKVKETQQLSFFNKEKLKATNAYPYELTADLLPGSGPSHGDGPRDHFYPGGHEGFYPFYASGYGYPYGFYPYGYGYPFGIGLGFGYYGGFGGYRGGFRGFRR